jgi:uncharacterized protein YndB with AHSA1/START domain
VIVGRAVALSLSAPERVWAALVDPRRWPAWDAGIAWIAVDAELAAGGYLTVKPRRGRQTAFRIRALDPPRRIVLDVGVGPLARLELAWSVEPGDGGAEIEQTVTIRGPLAKPILGRLAGRLAIRLADALNRLAARAV